MKATDLIKSLNDLVLKHGDLEVEIKDHIEGNDWEANFIEFEPSRIAGYYTDVDTGKREDLIKKDIFVIN